MKTASNNRGRFRFGKFFVRVLQLKALTVPRSNWASACWSLAFIEYPVRRCGRHTSGGGRRTACQL